MGRSGTTWVGDVVNHDFTYRVLFEPFQPARIREASIFGPFAYVSPGDRNAARIEAAEKILSGKTPRGPIDRGHRGRIFRKRIVKDVRCNLMLGWLRKLRPGMPIVLVVRNPFSVAASWIRLGWGKVAGGEQFELDVITDQAALLHDFPDIRLPLATIDRTDSFERVIAQWCILHLVPFAQLTRADAHVLFYEDLIAEPAATTSRLADYLRVRIEGPSRDRALATNSETDFLARGSDADRAALLMEWSRVLSARQIARGGEILASFGMDRFYGDDGRPKR
jgi:hypothetical protein